MLKYINSDEVNIIGEVVVGYRRTEKMRMMLQPQVTDSLKIANYARQLYPADKLEHVEQFFLILLNRCNRVLGWCKISSGSVCGTIVDARTIFQVVLNSNATQIVLVHNHPSGNITPSESDKTITDQLKKASVLMDITLLDHVILTSHDHFSFTDDGLL